MSESVTGTGVTEARMTVEADDDARATIGCGLEGTRDRPGRREGVATERDSSTGLERTSNAKRGTSVMLMGSATSVRP